MLLPGASAYTSDKKNPVAHDDLYEWRSGWIFNSFSVSLICSALPQAIQCSMPLIPINGRIGGTSGSNYQRRYAVGALVTFSCTEGHSLVGEASIVCTETGFWSHSPPFCKAQCPYPGDPRDGLIAPLKFHYDPGDELTVQCRPGFVEVNTNGPTNRPHCLADGNWSSPVPSCRNYEEV